MPDINILQRTVGINFDSQGRAVINIYAPLKHKVAVRLIKKAIDVNLQKNDAGFWTSVDDSMKPGDLYKIILDGEVFPDPTSLHQPQGVHGPSMAVDLNALHRSDAVTGDWKNLPLESYIFYELHVGTFTDEGTFQAVESKLDHLAQLGINAIEIMPIAQFPGGRNWGYDGAFPFAVQNTYGGYKGLKQLVSSCHSKGIAVVLDVVYNHLGPEGNYLQAFAPYFTGRHSTPWGDAINFDDAYCEGVRAYFIENVLMWFRDFGIDALRLDAVHAIKDESAGHILQEIKMNVNKLMADTGRTHYLVVEMDLNDNRYINPLNESGYGMDAQWVDEFHHALRIAAGGDRTAYYQDFNGIAHLAKSYKDAYVYDGQYSTYRQKKVGVKAGNPGKQFIVFSQNHDQVGNRMLGERTSSLTSIDMQRLMAAAVMVSPFLPMLFMGEEYGETNPFLYFVSHTDEALAQAVSQGRKREFAAFHTQGEAPDPSGELTFKQSKLQWARYHEKQQQSMFQYYKALISLRKKEPALYNLNRNNITAAADVANNTLTLHRWHNDEHLFCLMNFSKHEQAVKMPSIQQPLIKIFDSAGEAWGGSSAAPYYLTEPQVIVLQESILIYKATNEQSDINIPPAVS